MNPNEIQQGGTHYVRFGEFQPWNILKVYLANSLFSPFQAYLFGVIIEYLLRCNFKWNMLEDLKKARHSLDKLIEDVEKEEK